MNRATRKLFYNMFFFLLIVTLFTGPIGRAQEVSSIETEGSVSFTGIYEPIGNPDPAPPENDDNPPVVNPEGSLPQTNDSVQEWIFWLGVLIIIILYFLRRMKNNNKKKVGNIL